MLHIMRARARIRRPAAGYVENVVVLEASPFASNPLAAGFFPPLWPSQTPRRSPAPTSRGGRAFSERAQRRDFALNSATKFAEQDIKLESGRMIFSLLRHVGMFGHFAVRGKELPLAITPLPVSRSHRSPSHKWVRGTVIP